MHIPTLLPLAAFILVAQALPMQELATSISEGQGPLADTPGILASKRTLAPRRGGGFAGGAPKVAPKVAPKPPKPSDHAPPKPAPSNPAPPKASSSPSGGPEQPTSSDAPLPDLPTFSLPGSPLQVTSVTPAGPTPTNAAGFAPGACGVHIVQYQKNEGPSASDGSGTSSYRMDVTLFDANQQQIGQVLKAKAPTGVNFPVDSLFPLTLDATAGAVDSDPVSFAYGSQTWDSSSSHCKMGAYDSGSRQGDCGFTC